MLYNKPTIYNTSTIYNNGAGGGGGGSGEYFGVVKIGGIDYPYIQLGDKFITTKNLDFKLDNFSFGTGSSSNPLICYYGQDETTAKVQELGLMYNWAAVKYFIDNYDFGDGWKIIDIDLTEQINILFNPSMNIYSSKDTCRKHTTWATTNWNNEGNNKSHLSFIPSGRLVGGQFDAKGSYFRMWTSSNNVCWSLAVSPYSKWPGRDTLSQDCFCSIRLFKQMDDL